MNEVAKFLAERGDYTLRLNYNLDKDSIVIDAGGYKGWFAENIYNNYGKNIFKNRSYKTITYSTKSR
jgi:hypothetical protein